METLKEGCQRIADAITCMQMLDEEEEEEAIEEKEATEEKDVTEKKEA